MRMPSAMLTVVMLAAGLSGLPGLSGVALATQAQPQPAPAGQGGAIGGVPRRPAQPGPRAPGPQGRGPVRDPRQAPPEGTATVRGRVVDAATGVGIPRAKVRLNGRDQRSSRVVTTDTEGLFTLTRVPAGSLALTVEKVTYVQTMYPDRRRTMRASGVNVGEGQTIDDIVIQLSRGSVITGRVVDIYGDPIENVMIQAFPTRNDRSSQFRGTRTMQTSNDIGEYRISRLEPGQYYLLATPQRRPMGGVEDGGNAPGRTYYPGVASIDQAQPVTVERGGSISADFQMLETTLTRVSGFLLNAKGGPARGGHVSARTTAATKGTPGNAFFGMPDGGGAGVDQNGAFELMLQPGEYIIEGMAPQGDEAQGRTVSLGGMDRGQVKLMVGGESISGVTIASGAGGTVSGRFVFKGTGAAPTHFAALNIGLSGPTGMPGDDCRAFDRAKVNPDGTFLAENVWGTCQIRATGSTKGWAFDAIMHNGNDITNRVIEFGTGSSIAGVEVVFSDRVGDLAVTVADERGTPTQDYVAVAFPVEKDKWGDQRFLRFQVQSAPNAQSASNPQTGGAAGPSGAQTMPLATLVQGGPYSGMINSTFSGPGMMTAGGNSFNMLLAGDYFAVALEDAAIEDLRDPEYLERLSQLATRVSVSAGGKESLQLRRVKAPE